MRAPLFLMIAIVGTLAGCVSGKPHSDTYTDKSGKTTAIQSDREQCESACNADNARCGDTTQARDNDLVHAPTGMFGASSQCRDDLSRCLSDCKSR